PHIKLTKYRIDGSLRSRWPKRLYEGGSGIVTLTMIPSGREFQEQPKNEGGLGQVKPYTEEVLVKRPRIRMQLASDKTIDVSEPNTQVKQYDSRKASVFS